MASLWFYRLGTEQIGPVNANQIRSLAKAGTILPGTPIRKSDDSNWLKAARIKGLFDGVEPVQRTEPERPDEEAPDPLIALMSHAASSVASAAGSAAAAIGGAVSDWLALRKEEKSERANAPNPTKTDIVSQEVTGESMEPVIAKALREDDEFWAHKVRRLKWDGCTDEVIREARKNIPYPAAFREIAIAIRKNIRSQRKQDADSSELLKELYKWAVIESFFQGTEWHKIVNADILHTAARQVIKSIKTPYETIGYAKLLVQTTDASGTCFYEPILKKTDVKWLVKAFGEPHSHSTAQDANPELWQTAVEVLRVAIQRDEQHFWRSHGFDGPP